MVTEAATLLNNKRTKSMTPQGDWVCPIPSELDKLSLASSVARLPRTLPNNRVPEDPCDRAVDEEEAGEAPVSFPPYVARHLAGSRPAVRHLVDDVRQGGARLAEDVAHLPSEAVVEANLKAPHRAARDVALKGLRVVRAKATGGAGVLGREGGCSEGSLACDAPYGRPDRIRARTVGTGCVVVEKSDAAVSRVSQEADPVNIRGGSKSVEERPPGSKKLSCADSPMTPWALVEARASPGVVC